MKKTRVQLKLQSKAQKKNLRAAPLVD